MITLEKEPHQKNAPSRPASPGTSQPERSRDARAEQPKNMDERSPAEDTSQPERSRDARERHAANMAPKSAPEDTSQPERSRDVRERHHANMLSKLSTPETSSAPRSMPPQPVRPANMPEQSPDSAILSLATTEVTSELCSSYHGLDERSHSQRADTPPCPCVSSGPSCRESRPSAWSTA